MDYKKTTILYAEDDIATVAFIKVLFRKVENVYVEFAKDGQKALEAYKSKKFDLVITDMIMPIMNGFELVEEIKKIDNEQVFMMVTGLDNREDLIRAIELKIGLFVEKPIKVDKFYHILEDAIKLVNQKKDLEFSNLMLKQYQNAIDCSSMILKTDTQGRITYANKKFCDTSKYEEKELLGKHYDIFKDDNLPNIYEEIWETIEQKKTWKGILKNIDKNGNLFIVDTLIMPLVDINNNIIEYLAIKHDITQLELYKYDLQHQLDLATHDIEETQKEVIFTMGAIGETRSKETGQHVKRVAEYSYLLARLAGIDEDKAEILKMASPMHDIGKVGIADSILNKPGKLTKEEFEIMKTHAYLGYEMLKGSTREIMKTSAIVAYEHHEKWDGSGYPRGLKAEEIHIYGRITAVCDVFDALGSDRVYKKAWKLDKIVQLFKDERGKHFDPKLVDLFLSNLDKFLEIRDNYKD